MKNDKYEFSRGSSHSDKNSGSSGNFVKNGHSSISISQSKRKKKDILTYGICLLLSLVLWIYVMNVGITDYEQSFTVSVDILGDMPEEYILYPNPTSNNTVTVHLKGKKTDILSITPEKINAYVSLNSIEEEGSKYLSVNVEKIEGISMQVEKINPSNLTLNVCNRISKTVMLSADISNIPMSNEYVYDASIAETEIEISGPDELINRIVSARAVCNRLSAVTETVELESDFFVFYDNTGNAIASGDMAYITASLESVSVTVNVRAGA